MELGLKGRTAVVGGSSRGIGRAIARALAEEGAGVLITGREPVALEATREALAEATGARIVAAPGDLSEPAAADRLHEVALATLGPVDILVTNTGGPPTGRFEELGPAAWDQAVRGLLESALNLTRAVLPGMKTRGWGRITHVTSVAVKQPIDGLMLSNSVRAAVTGFARTLANEVAPFGITVNCVLPGYTRTDRLVELASQIAEAGGAESREAVFARWEAEIPAGRLGEPAELAALVAFLSSERAAYITGTSIPVDGGWTRALL
ncbi:MAG: SDR family oxidoreductase [Gemmatimonadota bacterium]|nr:MAG: SDR family oxidoreductase [Gemmatimonadota bacterium]